MITDERSIAARELVRRRGRTSTSAAGPPTPPRPSTGCSRPAAPGGRPGRRHRQTHPAAARPRPAGHRRRPLRAACWPSCAGACPACPRTCGSAEHIPLPDALADAVLMAQAWHWVDRARRTRDRPGPLPRRPARPALEPARRHRGLGAAASARSSTAPSRDRDVTVGLAVRPGRGPRVPLDAPTSPGDAARPGGLR
jgi:hypothetical protein